MTVEHFVALAQALVDSISLDDNGMMIGNQWVGGNGGLLSRDTVKAADTLRIAIAEIRGTPPDDPHLARAMRQRADNHQL